jgi:hypothetical protein
MTFEGADSVSIEVQDHIMLVHIGERNLAPEPNARLVGDYVLSVFEGLQDMQSLVLDLQGKTLGIPMGSRLVTLARAVQKRHGKLITSD